MKSSRRLRKSRCAFVIAPPSLAPVVKKLHIVFFGDCADAAWSAGKRTNRRQSLPLGSAFFGKHRLNGRFKDSLAPL
jgi:hypothetical protein